MLQLNNMLQLMVANNDKASLKLILKEAAALTGLSIIELPRAVDQYPDEILNKRCNTPELEGQLFLRPAIQVLSNKTEYRDFFPPQQTQQRTARPLVPTNDPLFARMPAINAHPMNDPLMAMLMQGGNPNTPNLFLAMQQGAIAAQQLQAYNPILAEVRESWIGSPEELQHNLTQVQEYVRVVRQTVPNPANLQQNLTAAAEGFARARAVHATYTTVQQRITPQDGMLATIAAWVLAILGLALLGNSYLFVQTGLSTLVSPIHHLVGTTINHENLALLVTTGLLLILAHQFSQHVISPLALQVRPVISHARAALSVFQRPAESQEEPNVQQTEQDAPHQQAAP